MLCFSVGGQVSLNALANFIYPSHRRSTGLGWSLGIGKFGSVIGRLLVGLLVILGIGLSIQFMLFSVLSLLTAITIYLVDKPEKPVAEEAKS